MFEPVMLHLHFYNREESIGMSMSGLLKNLELKKEKSGG